MISVGDGVAYLLCVAQAENGQRGLWADALNSDEHFKQFLRRQAREAE